jgi:hypothetical protein
MESPMDSLRTYVIVWLSGLVVGLALMERWHRTGGLSVPTAENVGEAVETDTASTVGKVSADHPKVSAVIVAGAKADAQRARQLLERVKPWGTTSAPSFAQLQRAGQPTTPGNTPDRPA